MVGNTYKDLSLILAEKQRVIDKLKEEKNSLLRVISHDIKSPFNQLFALIQLFEMEGENLGESQKEYLEKMYFAVISGIEMIQNLQDFRSIDEDKLQANIEKYDLNKLLKKIVARFQIQSRLMKVQVDLEVKKDPVFIRTDEILFLKVIEKILSNAIKYSPPGATVKITFEKVGSVIWIHTLDQGPGLTIQELPYIYDPFRTLSARPLSGGGTTGLGMYIVKKISQMLGIKVQIRRIRKGGLKVSLMLMP
jgi:signal transduction histidine kinase